MQPVDKHTSSFCAHAVRLAVVLALSSFALVTAFATPALAHNSLVRSEPAAGSTVSAVERVSFFFAKDVPLNTVTIERTKDDGAREQLGPLSHGPAGPTEVVADISGVEPGAMRLRWRLVGPDGHPVTGRVVFTITADSSDSRPTPIPDESESSPADDKEMSPATASGWMRWAFRFAGYLALMVVTGVVASAFLLWPRTWEVRVLRRAVAAALVVVAASSGLQWAVIAGDIAGAMPWSSSAIGKLGAALSTDAGKAFLARLLLIGGTAYAIFGWHGPTRTTKLRVGLGLTLAALGTWAYAGHARTMRWPAIGVPLDVAHYGAAAVWLGGLGVLGLVARHVAEPEELVEAAKRFARVAAWSVGTLVVTGVVQTVRLTGSPLQLFTATHGRLLIVKVAVLAAMLKVADVNRQRVSKRLVADGARSPGLLGALGRAMTTEMVAGVTIVALTAALVVSPPAVAEEVVDAAAEPAPSRRTTTPGPESSCENIPVLRKGDSGEDVECLQRALRSARIADVEITGRFDDATEAGVRAIQQQNSLEADGVVGPATASALGFRSP